jgi:carbon monoxide dehydrogenase subunit G
MRLTRRVTVDKPLHRVFTYLSDFTTTTEWDPGTVKTVRTAGNGSVGTQYQNTSKFAGRSTELTYVVAELVPNFRIALRGENGTVIARDTITIRASGSQTEVTYTADLTFKGAAKLIAPLMKPAFTRLGNEAEAGMASALARL